MRPGAALRALQRFAATGEPPRPADAAEARALASVAGEQGLAALLDEALARAGARWPADAAELLRRAHRAAAYRGEQLVETARRVRGLLGQAGLRALPLKGMALLGLAYETPAQRPMDDVDLLLLDGWDEGVALLRSGGFELLERADHAWAFRDLGTRAVVELHRGLSSCPEMFPVDAEALWARRTGRAGEERPSGEDLLVQLSVHAAFQHGLRLRLGQFLDFRRLLEATPIDQGRLFGAAQAARAESCLLASLEPAASLVGAPIPGTVLEALRGRASRGLLRKLARLRERPLGLLAGPPAARTLAGWRVALVGRRRLELIVRTLSGRAEAPGPGRLRRGLELARRLVRPV